jgi:hypothetical protein
VAPPDEPLLGGEPLPHVAPTLCARSPRAATGKAPAQPRRFGIAPACGAVRVAPMRSLGAASARSPSARAFSALRARRLPLRARRSALIFAWVMRRVVRFAARRPFNSPRITYNN